MTILPLVARSETLFPMSIGNVATLRSIFYMVWTLVALSIVALGQTESAIYTFTISDSFWPQGGLVRDADGNLFGATAGGGAYGMGAVFELSAPTQVGAGWKKRTLWNFASYGSGGSVPSTDLAMDGQGALYGATQSGGDPHCGCGVVYKLTPPTTTGGPWTHQVLHAFRSGGIDGRIPIAGLVLDTYGAIYGVTAQGGHWNGGTVYQVAPSGGTWIETVLYSFGSNSDGRIPSGALILDSSGSLYGVTSAGGVFDAGTAYRLTPPASQGKTWTRSILFSFKEAGGSAQGPTGNLVFDNNGDLYGVTDAGGGQAGYGTVYQLTPGTGSWALRVLFEFSSAVGTHPAAGLTWNPQDGSLYGTTSEGNPLKNGSGTVFQLSPPKTAGEEWKERTLYQFTFFGDGGWPSGKLVLDPNGILYGTASRGGVYGCDADCGVVYQIIP